MECERQRTVGMQVHPQQRHFQRLAAGLRLYRKPQADDRAAVVPRISAGFGHAQGIEVDRLRGPVWTLHCVLTPALAIERHRVRDDLQASRHRLVALQRAGRRNQFQDRQRWNHAEVVRPKHADQPFGQLGQFVIELVAQAPHQEGKALE
jgi:hypothetical protein